MASDVPLGGDIVQRLQRFGTYGRLKQIALRKVAHNIAADSAVLADIKAAFQKLDLQGTGQLNALTWLICHWFCGVQREEIQMLVTDFQVCS